MSQVAQWLADNNWRSSWMEWQLLAQCEGLPGRLDEGQDAYLAMTDYMADRAADDPIIAADLVDVIRMDPTVASKTTREETAALVDLRLATKEDQLCFPLEP